MEACNMQLDQESYYALILFRALPSEYQELAMMLLEEIQQKTTHNREHTPEEGETE